MDLHAVTFVLGLAALAAAQPARAGSTIERACLGSDRAAASPALCACLQQVADATLAAADQQRGAAFFANPHLSQEVRASDSATDSAFWTRWEGFAARADRTCR